MVLEIVKKGVPLCGGVLLCELTAFVIMHENHKSELPTFQPTPLYKERLATGTLCFTCICLLVEDGPFGEVSD